MRVWRSRKLRVDQIWLTCFRAFATCSCALLPWPGHQGALLPAARRQTRRQLRGTPPPSLLPRCAKSSPVKCSPPRPSSPLTTAPTTPSPPQQRPPSESCSLIDSVSDSVRSLT